jgi:D-alanyl-D-alanine carboxypeptidase (penicillin-binding protein 5/6)
MSRHALVAAAIAALFLASAVFGQPEKAPPAKKPADSLDGPPFVSAKAWAVLDGKTGAVLAGEQQTQALPMASTTKIMTAWIVISLAAADPKVLDEVVVYSERAAKTPGSSARLQAGEKLPVRDLLYGLLLPSGNDAAVALAEHFGPRFGEAAAGDGLDRFVAEMNARARALGLKGMAFHDPNGLSRENVASAGDLSRLAWEAMKDERFRKYVTTRHYECDVLTPSGGTRKAAWDNTNKLLDIEGYEGVKTGTTTAAGNCLVASGKRGDDRLIVVVLGSTTTDGRYQDARNLFRWAWLERSRKADAKSGK